MIYLEKNCGVGVKQQSLTQYLFGFFLSVTISLLLWGFTFNTIKWMEPLFFYSFLEELFSFKSGKMVPFHAISMK
jgi:hypothetical protein